MSENRIDPTVTGLFLVGFITLVFGLIGILGYAEADGADNLTAAVIVALPALAVIFTVLAVSAIRIGNTFAAPLFAFVAVALYGAMAGLTTFAAYLFYVLAIVFILFAIVAFIVGAPKLLAILLIFVALLYLFVGVFIGVALAGNDPLIYALLFGIFGVLAAAVALYMSFALSTQKLPVF